MTGSESLRNESYHDLSDEHLGKEEREVYDAIAEMEPVSDRMLAVVTGKSINRITARRNALVHKWGAVIDAGKFFDPFTKRKVTLWRTRP
jgi:hypothetical protein